MNIVKYVPKSVTRAVGRTTLKMDANAPKLLFVGGVVGVVGATVLACRATLKVESVLVEHEKMMLDIKHVQHARYTEQDRKHDKVTLYMQTTVKLTRLYAPSVILGSISIAALTKSHNLLQSRNAALSTAYAGLSATLDQYRARVQKELGEEKETEIWNDVQVVEVPDGKGGVTLKKVHGANGGGLYTDLFSADTTHNFHVGSHEANIQTLRQRENYLNDMLRIQGHLFLNEARKELGLDPSPEGQLAGWLWKPDDPNFEGDSYVSFRCWGDQARDSINPLMMNNEDGIFLDFNVVGDIHRRFEETKPLWKVTDKALRRARRS